MSHTPGPWTVEPMTHERQLGTVTPISSECGEIGLVYGGRDGDCRSNAHLIAAAPDLLEMLQLAVHLFENYGLLAQPKMTELSDRDWINESRAAIAKAKGGAE